MKKTITFLSLIILLGFSNCTDKDIPTVNAPTVDPDIGDINLNGIQYEIADAVLYTNYFVYGDNVFTVDKENQERVSDLNLDGMPLTTGDFVVMSRIVVGNMSQPQVPINPITESIGVDNNGIIFVTNPMAAANVIVEGNETPQLLADNMEMIYNYDGVNTRIFIYNLEVEVFSGDFLRVNNVILSIELGSVDGANVTTTKVSIPTIPLHQNFPNPFNGTTTFIIELAEMQDVHLAIYTLFGQIVFERKIKHAEAGVIYIEWDATNVASGAYYYNLVGSNLEPKFLYIVK